MKEHSFGEQIIKENAAKDDPNKKSVIDMARNAWGDSPVQSSPLDKTQERAKLEAHGEDHRLAEASHRIKLLNNELHKPGGALASSALELVGFDRNGRLLLVQRDQKGQVDGKYLVDSESGKIVARTRAGQLEKWEHSPDYNKKGDSETGAVTSKDSAGRVHEVTDFHGDKRTYERDSKGNLTEVTITARGQEPVIYRQGSGVADVSNHLWYKQPQIPGESVQGLKFDVKADGTLIQYNSATQFVIYSPDGTITEHRADGQEVITRRGKANEKTEMKPTDLSAPKPGALLA